MTLPGQTVLQAPVCLELTIPGTPRPQGSLTLWTAKDGTERAKNSPRMVEHRNLAVGLLRGSWGPRPAIVGPAHVRVRFLFQRPASHYGTGRNRGTLRDAAPLDHVQAPDLDKLVRLVFDALTVAGVWRDDQQAVRLDAVKRWTDGAPFTTVRLAAWGAP